MNEKENIDAKFLIYKSGDLLLARRSQRLRRAGGVIHSSFDGRCPSLLITALSELFALNLMAMVRKHRQTAERYIQANEGRKVFMNIQKMTCN